VKLKPVAYSDKTIAPGWRHWCPGCKGMHVIPTDSRGQANGHKWTFDGNMEAPTFHPSINIVGQCHYWIRAGKIEYCSDSKHKLAGKTVALPDLETSGEEEDWS
jgi:hypothetical protein